MITPWCQASFGGKTIIMKLTNAIILHTVTNKRDSYFVILTLNEVKQIKRPQRGGLNVELWNKCLYYCILSLFSSDVRASALCVSHLKALNDHQIEPWLGLLVSWMKTALNKLLITTLFCLGRLHIDFLKFWAIFA